VLAVRDMLGHDSLTSTQVYVNGLDTERLREAMEGRSYRDGNG
jgi:site-specific recombinase XerD